MAQNWTWGSQAAVKKKYGHENEKTFKEEESIEILEILGLIIQKSIKIQIIMPEKKTSNNNNKNLDCKKQKEEEIIY